MSSELKCGGVRVIQRSIHDGKGGGYTVPVVSTCQYEMVFKNRTISHILSYQFTLSLQ